MTHSPLRSKSCRVTIATAAILLFGTACSGRGDDSGGPELPDITGKYNVIVKGTTGCEDDDLWITGWAQGPLSIDGEPESLTFDFGDGMSFYGGVDISGGYSFAGDVTWVHPDSEVEAKLEVVNTGQFTWDAANSRWTGEGNFEIVVDDDEFTSNNCTISGPISIHQI